ncbi:MAG: hypothetical protein HWN67_02490 [Candidatus Helarchaeota archaeon]|nr:hypothetical protein [Candidatus Helarchaeota archaeon]
MSGRNTKHYRIKFIDESRKKFFHQLTKKTSFKQLSKKLNIPINNFYNYKSGISTTPEPLFNLGLKLIDKSKNDFEFQVLLPNWGCSKGAKLANVTPSKREQSRIHFSRIMKQKWKSKEFQESRYKPIKEQGEMTIEKIRIISHMLFDGSVNNRKGNNYFRFICSSPKVIELFINDVKTVYGLENNGIFDENSKNCVSINYNSILAIQDLMKYAPSYSCKSNKIQVPEVIKSGPSEFKREFLRCFWDDDGGITVSKKYKRFWLIGSQKNLKFLYEIGKIHDHFNINYLINDKYYHLLIVRKKDKKNFLRKIGFLEGSLVTRGLCKGLEKNFLLKELNLGIFP